MYDWEDVVARVKERKEAKQKNKTDYVVRREIKQEMWDELGFMWTTMGIFGDLCTGMSELSPAEREAFYKELERRFEFQVNQSGNAVPPWEGSKGGPPIGRIDEMTSDADGVSMRGVVFGGQNPKVEYGNSGFASVGGQGGSPGGGGSGRQGRTELVARVLFGQTVVWVDKDDKEVRRMTYLEAERAQKIIYADGIHVPMGTVVYWTTNSGTVVKSSDGYHTRNLES